MDWNSNLRPPFGSRPENTFSFLYNYNYDHYPGLEMKYPAAVVQGTHAGVGSGMEKNMGCFANQQQQQQQQGEKKKRLTSEQLESLESSFQEEIKLDPDRKMKLARELGMQPRQVAVWFQNRRARWKAKQLEHLYDTLKREYDAVSRDKQRLQEEVLALKSMLKEQAPKNQVSTGYTEISGTEETVESTSVGNRSTGKPGGRSNPQNNMGEGCYVFNVDNDYAPVLPPPPPPLYWGTLLPSYP